MSSGDVPRGRPRRVLIVEDNAAHAQLASLWLAQEGHGRYETAVADRLSAGLDRLSREPFDVVLLDLSLPDSDRIETYRRARAHAPLTPIVVMTGIGDEQLALQSVHEGAQDYLVKNETDGRLLVRALDYAIVRKRADEAERQMLEAQRLESLSVLAGGVAHQMNNLLLIIVGNASLATTELAADHPARAFLRQIEVASERAARLARQMLAYSGRGGFVVRRLDLNDVVRTACDALERDLPPGVTLKTEPGPGPLAMAGDESQIAQLVFNLVSNAAEAVEPGSAGTVVVRTAAVRARPEDLARAVVGRDLDPGPYLRLEVIDRGSGMSPQVQARVFEPFYSTRLTGRGLGLPAALGIVRGHRGAMTLASTPGHGTHVTVLLPSTGAVS